MEKVFGSSHFSTFTQPIVEMIFNLSTWLITQCYEIRLNIPYPNGWSGASKEWINVCVCVLLQNWLVIIKQQIIIIFPHLSAIHQFAVPPLWNYTTTSKTATVWLQPAKCIYEYETASERKLISKCENSNSQLNFIMLYVPFESIHSQHKVTSMCRIKCAVARNQFKGGAVFFFY